jgi:MoxR-like ATPase
MTSVTEFVTRVIDNVESIIVGKREQIELVMVALLCQGHVLIQDVPGTGKTMLARAVALLLVQPMPPSVELQKQADLLNLPVYRVWQERDLEVWR